MRFLQAILITFGLAAGAALGGPLDRTERFRPDVYPSKILAAEGAARRVADALNGSAGFSEKGRTIMIKSGPVCGEACDTIAAGPRDEFRGADVRLNEPLASDADRADLVWVEPTGTEDAYTVLEPTKRVRTKGTFTLTGSGGGIEGAFTTRFVDKPWAADFRDYVHGQPKRSFVLGQSTKLMSSESDALTAARQSAARELWEPVKARMNQLSANRRNRIVVDEGFVRRQVEGLLKTGRHVEDTFVQKLQGPSGEVWSASILVDASRERLDAIVAHVGQAARAQVAAKSAQRAEQARGWGAVAAFLAVIVLLYLLVNSVTRGYFMWRLRAAALLLCIVGILVALAVT